SRLAAYAGGHRPFRPRRIRGRFDRALFARHAPADGLRGCVVARAEGVDCGRADRGPRPEERPAAENAAASRSRQGYDRVPFVALARCSPTACRPHRHCGSRPTHQLRHAGDAAQTSSTGRLARRCLFEADRRSGRGGPTEWTGKSEYLVPSLQSLFRKPRRGGILQPRATPWESFAGPSGSERFSPEGAPLAQVRLRRPFRAWPCVGSLGPGRCPGLKEFAPSGLKEFAPSGLFTSCSTMNFDTSKPAISHPFLFQRLRFRLLRNSARALFQQSTLRILTIVAVSVVVGGFVFGVSLEGFHYLRKFDLAALGSVIGTIFDLL